MGSGSSVPTAPDLKDIHVERGEDFSFSWEANYEVDGQWKKDDQNLTDGGRIRITQSKKTKNFNLMIINAKMEDEGKYTLELSNSTGSASGSAQVTVLVPPPRPTAATFRDIRVKKGEDITISWEANYEVKGQWKKDDQVLQDGGRIRITQSENPKRFALRITNAQEEDEGKYTLELSNSEGNASGSAEVKVRVPPPRPEEPKLKDIRVKKGEDITFSWGANYEVDGQWKKNDKVLQDGGRIRITQSENPKHFTLIITNAQEEDEGKYTLELSNSEGTASGSAEVKILEYNMNWRHIAWGIGNLMRRFLVDYKLSNKKAKQLHFLLCGPVGAGKSSVINSISCTFQGRACAKAIAGAAAASSQTTVYNTFPIKDNTGRVLPFVFSDTMGLENEEGDGVKTADIIKALKGELKEGYQFNLATTSPEGIRTTPTLDDKIHCLVYVIAANRISLLKESDVIIKKMHEVRKAASDLGIPQVVFMTHVDLCCPLVKEDLKHIYVSKEIKEMMQHCSTLLGVPMNAIFPVKNYSEQTDGDDQTDCLILDTLRNIVDFANDYLEHRTNL